MTLHAIVAALGGDLYSGGTRASIPAPGHSGHDRSVSLWLTGDASWLGVPGRAEEFELALATPLAQLRDAVIAAGTLTVCSQCAARREITGADLLPGVRIAGAAGLN